jgi:hypothetical protein
MRNELIIMMIAILLALGIILSQGPRKSQDKDKQESGVKTVTIMVTTSSVWDRNKPMKEIDISNMPYLRQGEITIYYFEPAQHRLAQEISQALTTSWRLVAKRLGILLGALKVALIALAEAELAELGGVYIRQRVQVRQPLKSLFQRPPESPEPPFPVIVPPDLQSLREADPNTQSSIYVTMPHEALHQVVSKALDKGWRFDPQTRGLEDGLAEYIGHLVARELSPAAYQWHIKRRVEAVRDLLQRREHHTYDLTREFPGHITMSTSLRRESSQEPSQDSSLEELAGYSVALAFWLQIAQKHGEGVIKTFWQRLSQRGFPNAKEAAQILSELTGEDIWARLQKMDLHEVLRTLEQAAASKP